MQPQTSVMFCLVLTFVTHIQGVQFSMHTTPDSNRCGLLQCWADKFFTDTTIFTVVSLGVYDITQSSMPVKLAFISVFEKLIIGESTVVNVTGNISSYHAELTLDFLDHSSCHNASYMCELDFANVNAQAQVIRETVSPGNRGNCQIASQIAKLAFQVKTHSDDLEKEVVQLGKENVELGKEVVELGKEVVDLKQQNVALKVELSKLQEKLNSSCDTNQRQCVKGMQHNASREHVCLWNKVIALCDTETDGGGWIIIQRRTNGDVDFYRDWNDYKNGFGTPDTDFWFGNDNIHNLTSQRYTELRIDIEYNGARQYAHYSHFDITDETSNYRLSVSGYTGTVGDGLAYHNGNEFHTYDKNYPSESTNCASQAHGAWWYPRDGCHYASNLNGLWGATNDTAIVWYWSTNHLYFTEMKIRHV